MDSRYLMLGRRNQITLPRDTVAEGVSIYRCERLEDGSVLLTPQVAIPASQAYFWTKRWQAGERKASEDIRSGRVHRHASAKDLAARLGKKRRG